MCWHTVCCMRAASAQSQAHVVSVWHRRAIYCLLAAVQVLLYLIRMADCSGIDLTAAV